ncbi:hypothetical protein P5673_023646, partial [Acropora cervicornis]
MWQESLSSARFVELYRLELRSRVWRTHGLKDGDTHHSTEDQNVVRFVWIILDHLK